MSLSVLNAAIHLIESDDSGELKLSLSKESLGVSPAVEALALSVANVFENRAKCFASFDEEESATEFANAQGDHFFTFSRDLATKFHKELSRYPLANNGVLFIAECMMLGEQFLLTAFLPQSTCQAVSSDLNISGVNIIALDSLTLAAKVNFGDLQFNADDKPCIQFLSHRAKGKNHFWLDVFEAHISLDARIQNLVLVQAIRDFAVEQAGQDKEDALSIKKLAFDYCNSARLSKENISLRELSSELPQEEVSFQSFVEDQGYELADSFPANRMAIKKLVKFSGSGGGLNIEFQQVIFNERIFYDVETDTLTIKGTPPNLRDQLTRYSLTK